MGISAENLTNLFNHGFTTKKDGHGFGLHSGANFARELGGSLIGTSDGLEQGATFCLTLPRDIQTTLETTNAAATPAVPSIPTTVIPGSEPTSV